MYDAAVIGAGINGCSIAYELQKHYKNIILFDKDGIAAGGSGAAGAFVSPKFSKAGALKELLDEAFIYSTSFYENYFPEHFTKSQLIHIAKDEKDTQQLQAYKKTTQQPLLEIPQTLQEPLTNDAQEAEKISLYTGIVDAQKMCQALACDVEYKQEEVVQLEYNMGYWLINNKIKAKKVILATGAYKQLLYEPYIGIRGVWGHRIDIKTSTHNPVILHHYLSISPSGEDGTLAIGATHDVHYHPQKNKEPYDLEKGRAELLEKAQKTIHLEDVEIVHDYTGLRSGSNDYIPILGKIVDSKSTIEKLGQGLKRKDINYDAFTYYPNIYMINGNGGYGFVLAPYLAKIATDEIINKKELRRDLAPARFFARWARRLKEED